MRPNPASTATEFHGLPTQKPSMSPERSAATIWGGGTTTTSAASASSTPPIRAKARSW